MQKRRTNVPWGRIIGWSVVLGLIISFFLYSFFIPPLLSPSPEEESITVAEQKTAKESTFFSRLTQFILRDDAPRDKSLLLSPGAGIFFLSPDGSDFNLGTESSPWKTFERALRPGALPDSATLYLMGGEYRVNAGALKDAVTARGSVKGTAEVPFTIASFPGERATLLLSERAPNTWQVYSNPDGKAIYYLNWRAYVESKSDSEWYTLTGYNNFRNTYWNPQGVFVHGSNPISLRQVNSSVTGMAGRSQFEKPISFRNNQTDMQAGDYYLEMNPSKADYGRLFVWLPDNSNPNSKQIEIATDEQLLLGYESEYLQIYNLDVRYSNFWGLLVGGHHNKIEGISGSYNAFIGLDGRCSFCSVSNSSFNYNGNSGSGFRGKRTVIESSIFDHNNWQRYIPGYHCGGMKLIECDGTREAADIRACGLANPTLTAPSEMVIRNNTFTNTHICGGVWFDWAGYGNIVEGNTFINNSFGISFETSNGTKDRPNIIRNNVFTQNMEGEVQELLDLGVYSGDHFPQVLISSSVYTDVIHNTFYKSRVGVVLSYSECGNALDPGNEARRRTLTNNNVLNNLFLNVTIPIIPRRTLTCTTTVDGPTVVRDNVVDYNQFYGSWISMGYLQNRQIGGPVLWSTPLTQITWCDDYGLCDLTLADWQARGYDQHSTIADPKLINPEQNNFHPSFFTTIADKGIQINKRGLEKDKDGIYRSHGGVPDIGAYEWATEYFNSYPPPTTKEVYVSQRSLIRGSGTQADPYGVNTPEQFSILMQSLPDNMIINFLPGNYYTYGFSAGDYPIDSCQNLASPVGWMPGKNWTIKGAGIDLTNITLVGSGKVGWNTATRNFAYTSIIGTPYNCFAHGLNVRDLTLDANFQGQDTIKELSTTGIGVWGSNISVNRVKVINSGSSSLEFENFPLLIGGGHVNYGDLENISVYNSIVKDSSPYSSRETTLLVIGGTTNYYDEANLSKDIKSPLRYPWNNGEGFVRNAYLINNTVDGTSVFYLSNGTKKRAPYHTILGAHEISQKLYNENRGLVQGTTIYACTGECIIDGNRHINVTHGSYYDSWRGKDLLVKNNLFTNNEIGFFFNYPAFNTFHERLQIINNTFEMHPITTNVNSYHTNGPGAGIWYYSTRMHRPFLVDNVSILNNTLLFYRAPGIPSVGGDSYTISMSYMENLTVAGNIIDVAYPSTNGINFYSGVSDNSVVYDCRDNKKSDGSSAVCAFYDPAIPRIYLVNPNSTGSLILNGNFVVRSDEELSSISYSLDNGANKVNMIKQSDNLTYTADIPAGFVVGNTGTIRFYASDKAVAKYRQQFVGDVPGPNVNDTVVRSFVAIPVCTPGATLSCLALADARIVSGVNNTCNAQGQWTNVSTCRYMYAGDLFLSDLTRVYNGTPQSASVRTLPAGLNVSMTYAGLATSPTRGGSYPLVATIVNETYEGTVTATFTITPAPQTLSVPDFGTHTVFDEMVVQGSTSAGFAPTFEVVSGGETFEVVTGGTGITGQVIEEGTVRNGLFTRLWEWLKAYFGYAAENTFAPTLSPSTLANGTRITFVQPGTLVLRAIHPGNENYSAPVSVKRTIVVSPAYVIADVFDQTTFFQQYTGAPLNVTVRVTGTNVLTPSFDVLYNDSIILPRNVGAYNVTIRLTDARFRLMTSSHIGILTITQADQSISYVPVPSTDVGQTVALSATASSGLPVTFSVTNGPATLAGNQLTVTGPGTIFLAITQVGDGNYRPATLELTLNGQCPAGQIPDGGICKSVCTSFTYSDFGVCGENGQQNRSILTAVPAGCVQGTPSLTQSCTRVCTPDASGVCDAIGNATSTGSLYQCNAFGTVISAWNTCSYTCNTGFVNTNTSSSPVCMQQICTPQAETPCPALAHASVVGYAQKCNALGAGYILNGTTIENTCRYTCDTRYASNGTACIPQVTTFTRNHSLIQVDSTGLFVAPNATNASYLILPVGFSQARLTNLSLTIEDPTDDEAYLIVQNLSLGTEETKMVVIKAKRSRSNAVCIADRASVRTKKQIKDNCDVLACPGTLGNYSCEVIGRAFIVSGLRHSGVIEERINNVSNSAPTTITTLPPSSQQTPSPGAVSPSSPSYTLDPLTPGQTGSGIAGNDDPLILEDKEDDPSVVTRLAEALAGGNRTLLYVELGTFILIVFLLIVVLFSWGHFNRQSSEARTI